MNYVVEYYELPDGTHPAEEFILEQDVKMRAKIFLALEFLEEKGPQLREPFSKPLGKRLPQLRWEVAFLRSGPNRGQTSAAYCISLWSDAK